MNTTEKIIAELKKEGFPNMEFLFSDVALEKAPEILEALLQAEREEFQKLLEIPKTELTFESFESEELLDYYWSLLHHLKGVKNSKKIREIIEEFRPKIQEFSHEVSYSTRYYEMTKFCFEHLHTDVDAEDKKRALSLRVEAFERRGVHLDEEKKSRLKAIQKRLSELSEKFSNNVLDDEEKFSYEVKNFQNIKDLPKDVLETAKKGEKYIFTADPNHYQAIMKYCSNPEIRKYFSEVFGSFASTGEYDNRENVLEILRLRQEKSEILGKKNFGELSLQSKMADTPEQVQEMIENISHKARIKSESEIEELKTYFGRDGLEHYDIAYYATKYKKEKYDFDDKIVKNYFEFGAVLQYLHNFVKNFYGIELREISASVYDEKVKIYEVYREKKLVAYYLLDAFYHKQKRAGAWADNLRAKSLDFGKIPVVVNVCNFLDTTPSLLTMRDTETLFHEFGHAIHEMLSASDLSELSGFHVEWDFVELPSQLLENWVGARESLEKFALHYETGEKIPEDLLKKLEQLKTYMSGNFTLRQNQLALLDMILHTTEVPKNIEALDEKTLDIINRYGLQKRGPEYKAYTSFGHIFAGGYAAGYYSYMWAEILEADVFCEIKKRGMFDPEVGKHFMDTLLAQGTRKNAGELFYDFMGREVSEKAFLERKGL